MKQYKRIKDLREDKDLTQKEIAKVLNISQRSYSHFENGTRSIPIDTLCILADFYQTSIDYIVERTNIKDFPPPSK